MVRESQLLTWEGWGFPLAEVRYDRVVIWHGVQDGQSFIRIVRYLAEYLPHCELQKLEEETHFTIVKHVGTIIEELVRWMGKGGRERERVEREEGRKGYGMVPTY